MLPRVPEVVVNFAPCSSRLKRRNEILAANKCFPLYPESNRQGMPKVYRITLTMPACCRVQARPLSHKRENDDPHRYQGGDAGDGEAEINTADDGVL
jgi:hypothetical protein